MASVRPQSPEDVLRNLSANQSFSQRYNVPMMVIGALFIGLGITVGAAGLKKLVAISPKASLSSLIVGTLAGLGLILCGIYKRNINKFLCGAQTRKENTRIKDREFHDIRAQMQGGVSCDIVTEEKEGYTKQTIWSYRMGKQSYDQILNLAGQLIDRCSDLNIAIDIDTQGGTDIMDLTVFTWVKA